MAMMTRWHKGGNLPQEPLGDPGRAPVRLQLAQGRVPHLPLVHQDVNALGKHLDKEKGQDDPLNRAILDVLEKLSELEDSGNRDLEEVAIHAAGIRNASSTTARRWKR